MMCFRSIHLLFPPSFALLVPRDASKFPLPIALGLEVWSYLQKLCECQLSWVVLALLSLAALKNAIQRFLNQYIDLLYAQVFSLG